MRIKFLPSGQEVPVDPNKTLLQICTENQIEIKSICKGVPSCAECRIRIVEGDYNVVPPSKVEMSLIGTNYFIDQRRLSCQVRCFGDVTVDLTEQIERSEIQNKKVRGFRAPGQKGSHVESQAKQGTLVLEETKHDGKGARPQGAARVQHQANVHGVESVESGHEHLVQTEGLSPEPQAPGSRPSESRREKGEGQNQGGGGGGRNRPRGGRNRNRNRNSKPDRN
jgi:ferredoxin